MKSTCRWFQRVAVALAVLFAYFSSATTCWAQGNGPLREPPGFFTWLPAYGVIFLVVGLGLMFVLKSAQRRDKEKPDKNFEE